MHRTQKRSANARQQQLDKIVASDLHLDDRLISRGRWNGCMETRNIVDVRGVWTYVRIVDFGFAKLSSNRKFGWGRNLVE